MSLFRRPKKALVQRRVFSAADDDENTENSENEVSNHKNGEGMARMDVDQRVKTPPPPCISEPRDRKQEKKSKDDKKSSGKTSLLSFGDEGRFIEFILMQCRIEAQHMTPICNWTHNY